MSRPANKIIHLKTYIKRKGETIMEEKEKKLARFSTQNVSEYCEILTSHNWALRAFGALLESADLETHFGSSNNDASEYQWGLNQIVKLYLEYQEKKLDELREKAVNSPDTVISNAFIAYEHVNTGCYRNHGMALEDVRNTIKKLNWVISEFGIEEYPQAGKARDKLLSLQEAIIRKMRGDAAS